MHPGYAINDDLNMIALVDGYPGGHPVPFLVFSNVLLGFLLKPLYALPTALNWQVLLFVLVQFVAVWALLCLVFDGPASRTYRAYGVLAVLLCDAYFIQNLTFTTTASFACIAGSCLILFAARSAAPFARASLWCGVALIVLGSLIRLEMSLVALSLALPAAIVAQAVFNRRAMLVAFVMASSIILAGFAVDRLYVRSSAEWHAYDVYNGTRSMLQDTHRMENLGRTIRRVGWSANDQELFARWFFPDQDVYSLEKLQYLVKRVSPYSVNPGYTLSTMLYTPFARFLVPYALIMLCNFLMAYAHGVFRRASTPLLAIAAIVLADNAYFALAWKIADRMLLSSLSSAAIVGFLIPYWMAPEGRRDSRARSARAIAIAAGLVMAVALSLTLVYAAEISQSNARQQVLYTQLVADLDRLQRDGAISKSALIVSPAHGLPLEWSNPFTLAWPRIPYLDTGWMTFSPRYREILGQFDAAPLTDALYKKDNIYLMTRINIIPYIARYYVEHERRTVEFRQIYEMPNPYHVPGYDGVYLYKVVRGH
jgi:hypothetical protein